MGPTKQTPRKPEDDRSSHAHNPGEDHFDELINREFSADDKQKMERSAQDGAADDITEQSDPDKELRGLREREAGQPDGDSGKNGVKDQEAQPEQPWQTDVGNQSESGQKKNSSSSKAKKAGIIATVVATLALGGFGLFYGLINSFLVSMKENYYEWSMKRGYTRTAQRAAKSFQKQVFTDPADCTGIRCRYKSGVDMDQIKKIERQGATVDYEESPSKKGRYVVRTITLLDGTQLTRDNYLDRFKDTPTVRGFHARATDVSGKFPRTTKMVTKLAKLGFSRKNQLEGANDDKERKGKLRQYLFGADSDSNAVRRAAAQQEQDENGRPIGQDEVDRNNGLSEDVAEAARAQREALLADPDARPDIRPDVGAIAGGAAGGATKGAVRGLSLTGGLDTACSAYRLLQAVDYGAKFYRAAALIKYAGFFMTFADAVKTGKVTPAQINFVASMLFSTDDKGRNFFDSPGFQNIVYKVKPNPASTALYTNGTSFGGSLGDVRRGIDRAVGGKADETCGVIQSTLVRVASGVASVGLAIFTFGGSTIASALIGVGSGVLLGIAEAYALPILVSYAAGTVVTGDENGYEIGSAIAAGMGALSGNLNRSQGLRPVTKDELAANEAELTLAYNDFFGDNKPTLTEKIATNMTSFAVRTMSSGTSLLTAPQNAFAYAGTNSSLSSAYAVEEAVADDTCKDPEYTAKNIATDIFCNPIYSENLSTVDDPRYDPEVVMEYMIENKHVDPETGAPTSEEYKKYSEICLDGIAPAVDFVVEDLAIPGGMTPLEYCGTNVNEQTTNFRFFRWDSNIVEPASALNDEFYNSGAGAPGGAAPGAGSGQLANCGSAQQCAQKILDSPNFSFQTAQARTSMEQVAATGTQQACGSPPMSPVLLSVLLTASEKYKIVLGSYLLGRSSCTDGQHPQGKAIDLNGVSTIDGSVTTGNTLRWNELNGAQAELANRFVADIGALFQQAGGGGVGQKGCPAMRFTPPPGVQYFTDTCNHLHIDVRGT